MIEFEFTPKLCSVGAFSHKGRQTNSDAIVVLNSVNEDSLWHNILTKNHNFGVKWQMILPQYRDKLPFFRNRFDFYRMKNIA